MPEIEELERKWRRYKLKKYRPLALGLLLLAAGGAAYLALPVATSEAPVTKPREAEKPAPVAVATPSPGEPSVAKVSSKSVPQAAPQPSAPPPAAAVSTPSPDKAPLHREKEVVLQPDTDFLAGFERSRPPAVREVRHEVIAPVPAPPRRVEQQSSPKPAKRVVRSASTPATEAKSAPEKPAAAQEKGGGLSISTKRTNNTLEYLIERFNQTRDPKLASYIAQSFYRKGDYEETVRWAIMANSVDPAGEESWILFAKAKVKLGQKEDAIKALKIYLNQYSSRKVRSYLQTLETGL